MEDHERRTAGRNRRRAAGAGDPQENIQTFGHGKRCPQARVLVSTVGEVRMPRTTELGNIPAVDLAYAVDRLIQEGKTSLAEVRPFADERPARIAALERELVTLKAGHAPAKAAGRPAGPRAAAAKKPKRKFTMTARARAARKRQGQYLAALKRLKGVERARVKTVAGKEGVAKA